MYIILFVTGLILASFINLLAYRSRNELVGYKFWVEPSHCEHCKKRLIWYELVPILSYLYTKGRCTGCKKKVFWYYPLSELFLGCTFLLFYLNSLPVLSYLLISVLFYFSYWDITTKSVPKITADIFFICSLLYFFVWGYIGEYKYILIEIVTVGILFLTIWIVNLKSEKIGMGDVIIISSIILFSGVHTGLLTILYSTFLAGLYAIVLVVKDSRNRKRYIPIVPFILLAFLFASIFPDTLKSLGVFI